MAYDQKAEAQKNWDKKLPVFQEFQSRILKEKLKKYKFIVTIQDPEDEKLKICPSHYGAGFENARLDFGGVNVVTIYSQFKDRWDKEPKKIIESMWMDARSWTDVLGGINYSRKVRELPEIPYKREGHKTLQSCIDEIERLRKAYINYFQNKE